MTRRTPQRFPVQTRVTETARDRIYAAAEASGRSVAQEVEVRLERSLERDDLRTLIREEIRAALAERDESRLSADWLSPIPSTQMTYRY